MLSRSPSIGKITRGKTHELKIQMHGEVVIWTNQLFGRERSSNTLIF
jgi:hypothetical protein